MITESLENPSASNYLPALLTLTESIIEATQQIITTQQKPALFLEPSDFIQLYYGWLEFVIEQKIIGNKEHLLKLSRDTIQQHCEQGRNLCQMVRAFTEQDAVQIDTLVKSNGLIVVPVLKFIQFISDIINQTFKIKIHPTNKKNRFNPEILLEEPVLNAFEDAFHTTVQRINSLQITNPLIFVLEHFSVMLGWTIGFFAQLSNKSTDFFFEKLPLKHGDI